MPVEEQEKRDIYTVYMEERILLFVGTWDDDGGDACCVEGTEWSEGNRKDPIIGRLSVAGKDTLV